MMMWVRSNIPYQKKKCCTPLTGSTATHCPRESGHKTQHRRHNDHETTISAMIVRFDRNRMPNSANCDSETDTKTTPLPRVKIDSKNAMTTQRDTWKFKFCFICNTAATSTQGLTVRLLVARARRRTAKLLRLLAARVGDQQSSVVREQQVLHLLLGNFVDVCQAKHTIDSAREQCQGERRGKE